MAAHGFIRGGASLHRVTPSEGGGSDSSDDDWAASCGVVVNLEAIGTGGREFLVRAVPNAG